MNFNKYPQLILIKWFNNHTLKNSARGLYVKLKICPLLFYGYQNFPGWTYIVIISNSSSLLSLPTPSTRSARAAAVIIITYFLVWGYMLQSLGELSTILMPRPHPKPIMSGCLGGLRHEVLGRLPGYSNVQLN